MMIQRGNGKETQVTSRFFTQECTCHYSIDDVADIVIEAAEHASQELGVGHSEATYENVVQNFLYDRRIPTRRQVRFFSHVGQDIVQTGILDLEVDRCVLVELKAGQAEITEDHKIQLRRYMKSAKKTYSNRPLVGLIILFSKTGTLKVFRMIFRGKREIHHVEEASCLGIENVGF